MARKTLQAYALLRAVNILGGKAEVAKLLRISQTKMNLYLGDLHPVPEAVFLRIIDILVDDELQRLLKARKLQHASNGHGAAAWTKNGSGKMNGNGRSQKA